MAGQDEEWFDVVDEHDRVIDRQRRADVHRQRLRPRAVEIILRLVDEGEITRLVEVAP